MAENNTNRHHDDIRTGPTRRTGRTPLLAFAPNVYALDTIAMVCVHAQAHSEDEALRKAQEVQSAQVHSATDMPEGVTITEVSVRYVQAIPYALSPNDSDVPTTFHRTSRAARLAELADACQEALATFRAVAGGPANNETPPDGNNAEHEAALNIVQVTELLVAEVRRLLADVDDDVL